MNDLAEFIRDLMSYARLDQARFSRALDVSQATVSRWLSGSEPKMAQRLKIEEFAKKVGFRDPGSVGKVIVMGRVGAGAEIIMDGEQIAPDGLFEVEVGLSMPIDSVAYEVVGDSMYPRYDNGDIIVCKTQGFDLAYIIGSDAAVLTEDGRRFLKTIEHGSEPGLFDLLSHNAKAIRNVKLASISPVYCIFPKGQWRRRS